MRALFALFLSIGLYADNEIYIDQTGDNAAIEQEADSIIDFTEGNPFGSL